MQLPKGQSIYELQPTAPSFRHTFRAGTLGGLVSREDDSTEGHSNVRLVKLPDKWSAQLQTRPSKRRTSAKSLAAGVADARHNLISEVDAEVIDVVTLGNLCVDIVKHVSSRASAPASYQPAVRQNGGLIFSSVLFDPFTTPLNVWKMQCSYICLISVSGQTLKLGF